VLYITCQSYIQHNFFMKGEFMMKSYNKLWVPGLLVLSGMLIAMEEQQQGPMNAEWFYGDNAFKAANEFHQSQQWFNAEQEYCAGLIEDDMTSEYDRSMAHLNFAACRMAQGKESLSWRFFDNLIGIAGEYRLSRGRINSAGKEDKKTVLVKTNVVGIGDIFHFLLTAYELKKRTGWNVIVSVRDFLKETLRDAVQGYGLILIGEKDEQPKTDYTTHIIGLLGHLNMHPAATNPEKVMFTAPERAMNVVAEQVDSVLRQGKNLMAVFAGEDRQATFIGGKQLPRDTTKHGRHLTSEPFNRLLKKYPNLMLMDCGTSNGRVVIDEKQRNQYMILAQEERAFDTTIALARIMSYQKIRHQKKEIVCIGADQGPANVFARSLDSDAQKRMAFIIPNAQESDMRMQGVGLMYKHMLSDCWVYKCQTPQDQGLMIEMAYCAMTTDK
jgi:hypothetical protein